MIANRELGMDDYLAMARRRVGLVLVPALLASLIGFLISFALTPKYTSRALLLVEGQIVPTGYVTPIVTESVSARMTTLQQNMLSVSRLQPLVTRLGLARKGKSVEAVIDEIRNNVSVSRAYLGRSGGLGGTADVPGFWVSYTTDNPHDAQQVCSEITSLLLAENLELRERVAQSTTDFLSLQLDQAKHNLDDMDSKLSHFKMLHFGQMPGDVETNLKIYEGLSSQLDANAWNLTRLQQDKAAAETLLSQELAAMKSAQASPTFSPLRQQLLKLETQLVLLKTRYTDDHPDVVKAKHQIEDLQAKLKDLNAEAEQSDALRTATVPREGAKLEPPDIMRLRDQIRRSESVIERASAVQKRLQDRLDLYQDRMELNPDLEDEYKQLTRDYTTAHNIYDQLLTNKTTAEMQTEMERKQEGEQLKLLDPASLPHSPSYPVRSMFALYGLGVGLALGLTIALWLEFQDKKIRNEGDVLAALEMPMLGSVPWAGVEGNGRGAKSRFGGRLGPLLEEEKAAES
jgi:polysaccharide chain length determinant protein (PEP-CTERM system associated)